MCETMHLAYQIQSEGKPKFDSILIALGAFHLEISLFHAYGQFMQNLVDLTY